MLENLLLRHPPSGLLVLAAPTEPSSADQIGRADLARILNILRERCAYIVVDTSANFAEVTLAALESSDDILVMAGLDVMSLKSARIGLQTMRVLGIPFSSGQVRAQPGQHPGGADRGRRRAGRCSSRWTPPCPSDILVAESVNRGVPVVTSAPRSKFAKSIDDLADDLMPSLRRHRRSPDKPCEGMHDVAFRPPAQGRHLHHLGGGAGARSSKKSTSGCTSASSRSSAPSCPRAGSRPRTCGRGSTPSCRRPWPTRPHRCRLADKARLGEDIANDILGYGPIQGYLEDPERLRGHGQRARPGLRRARRQDRAHADVASSTRPTCAGSSTRSWARSAGGSTSRRPWSTPASPTAHVSTP